MYFLFNRITLQVLHDQSTSCVLVIIILLAEIFQCVPYEVRTLSVVNNVRHKTDVGVNHLELVHTRTVEMYKPLDLQIEIFS
jgi:hypothetical protein